jgi:quaternary ammonium compound-resistance protein SugE
MVGRGRLAYSVNPFYWSVPIMMAAAWLQLLLAGLVEIAMAMALKQSQGWTRLWPGVIGIVAALASVFLLTSSLRHLPVGLAYAIWTGIGAAGVTLLGILLFGESAAPLRLLFIALIVGGIIGLRWIEA